MKFGRILEKLKENPIFKKYFKDKNFLPYKKLKKLIKDYEAEIDY